MAASQPLKGMELIDCARANAREGVETATRLCGYGDDTQTFMQAVRQACSDIGVNVQEINDLITDQTMVQQRGGIEVAPDTPGQL